MVRWVSSLFGGGGEDNAEGQQPAMQPLDRVRLLTIPHSSYCEAARWLLQAGRVPYREELWMMASRKAFERKQPFHSSKYVTSVRALEPEDSPQRAARHAASIPIGVLEKSMSAEEMVERRNTTMVPLALPPLSTGPGLLGDSFEIAQYAAEQSDGALAPVSDGWQPLLDEFGAACRMLCYQHLSPQLASAELSLEQQLDLNADFWLCVDGGEYTFDESKKALEPRFDGFSRMLGSVFRCVQTFEYPTRT